MLRRRSMALMPAALLLAVACGHGKMVPIEDGRAELKADQGLLLVHTYLQDRFSKISIGDAFFDAPKPGAQLQLMMVPAGEYRWTSFHQGNLYYKLDRDEPAYAFRVEPGQINYPGEMVMESGGFNRARFYTRNRSAMVLRDLEEMFPQLSERFHVAYTGFQRDDFLIHYRGLRERMAGKKPRWVEKLEAL